VIYAYSQLYDWDMRSAGIPLRSFLEQFIGIVAVVQDEYIVP
jgi:hypothetical protein